MTITLREISDDNLQSVLALRTTSEQERFVSTVTYSLAEAAAHPEGNPWFRAVYADEQPVGFVMLSWDVEPAPPEINGPWFLWKLLIDHRHQGQGHGREVVRQIVDLVRSEGASELLTSFVPGEGGPAGFYARLGFVPARTGPRCARSSPTLTPGSGRCWSSSSRTSSCHPRCSIVGEGARWLSRAVRPASKPTRQPF